MATNHVDVWFCVDVLFSTYKMLIVLYQSKKCNQGHILPPQAVEISRKSVKIFQSLLASSAHAFWGIRYVKNATYLSSYAQLIVRTVSSCSTSLSPFLSFVWISLETLTTPIWRRILYP